MAGQPTQEETLTWSVTFRFFLNRPRFGIIAPLAERYQALADKLAKFGETAPAPITELACDQAEDRLAELMRANAPPPPTPMMIAARDENFQLRCRIDAVVADIQKAQRSWLPYARRDWRHKVRRSVTADMATELPAERFSFSGNPDSDSPEFADLEEARQANQKLRNLLQYYTGIGEQLKNAQAFDASLPADKALELPRDGVQ
jgi:hypothetical protein